MSNKIINNKVKNRSKKYSDNLNKIKEASSKKDVLSIKEAVELLFSLDQPKFKEGAMIEFHAKLNINTSKSDQSVRASAVLPNGNGKKVRVIAFVTPDKVEEAKKAGADIVGGEELIEQIKQSGELNFDKAVAQPELMKKLPSIARLLGTAGLMPNPKTGSVSDDVSGMINAIKAGKVDFKNDKTGNIHVGCGKINAEFSVEKIVENIESLMTSLEKNKPEGVKKALINRAYLSSTFSPSIRIV
jgi:large subunit ribosomal protein L1